MHGGKALLQQIVANILADNSSIALCHRHCRSSKVFGQQMTRRRIDQVTRQRAGGMDARHLVHRTPVGSVKRMPEFTGTGCLAPESIESVLAVGPAQRELHGGSLTEFRGDVIVTLRQALRHTGYMPQSQGFARHALARAADDLRSITRHIRNQQHPVLFRPEIAGLHPGPGGGWLQLLPGLEFVLVNEMNSAGIRASGRYETWQCLIR